MNAMTAHISAGITKSVKTPEVATTALVQEDTALRVWAAPALVRSLIPPYLTLILSQHPRLLSCQTPTCIPAFIFISFPF